ncbi:hypothetical protein AAV32_09495 [Kerstersia gyiorum]|uniref:Uncharacterized protein n=1 Tax=Kerstersia gyiorum TaxID=206506 RepID=A0A171KSD5_9BURK|nr:hypothetical protein AAV32_09495 [Kerstersia gyiorum]
MHTSFLAACCDYLCSTLRSALGSFPEHMVPMISQIAFLRIAELAHIYDFTKTPSFEGDGCRVIKNQHCTVISECNPTIVEESIYVWCQHQPIVFIKPLVIV